MTRNRAGGGESPTIRKPIDPRAWWSLALFAAVLAAAAVFALAEAPPVRAGTSDLRSARSRYPDISGTVLDACSLCHVSETNYRLDDYGRDYSRNRRDFAAIETLDSDGDGFTNLEEITALTFPGKADSHPIGTPTSGASETPTASATLQPTATATPSATATATEGSPVATDVPDTTVHFPYAVRRR